MNHQNILNSWLEHKSKEILNKIPPEGMIVLLLKSQIDQMKSEIDELRSTVQSMHLSSR